MFEGQTCKQIPAILRPVFPLTDPRYHITAPAGITTNSPININMFSEVVPDRGGVIIESKKDLLVVIVVLIVATTILEIDKLYPKEALKSIY